MTFYSKTLLNALIFSFLFSNLFATNPPNCGVATLTNAPAPSVAAPWGIPASHVLTTPIGGLNHIVELNTSYPPLTPLGGSPFQPSWGHWWDLGDGQYSDLRVPQFRLYQNAQNPVPMLYLTGKYSDTLDSPDDPMEFTFGGISTQPGVLTTTTQSLVRLDQNRFPVPGQTMTIAVEYSGPMKGFRFYYGDIFNPNKLASIRCESLHFGETHSPLNVPINGASLTQYQDSLDFRFPNGTPAFHKRTVFITFDIADNAVAEREILPIAIRPLLGEGEGEESGLTWGEEPVSRVYTIRKGHDPNGITVDQSNVFYSMNPAFSYEPGCRELIYTIHFQNIGEAEVGHITLDTQLDPQLNPGSVEILDWSPVTPQQPKLCPSDTTASKLPNGMSYQLYCQENRVIFDLKGVFLAGTEQKLYQGQPLPLGASTSGYVTFKVKTIPNPNLSVPLSVKANIQFDNLPWLLTNATSTPFTGLDQTGIFAAEFIAGCDKQCSSCFQEKPKGGRRWPLIIGILVVIAVLGLMVLRRRRQQELG
ncbi:MAG: hypothetical protein AAF206_18125 [Bacteroidota bacterium]